MTKNQEIDKLFELIIYNNPQMGGKIKKDGIIDESIYDLQEIKILFICKEGNDPKQKAGDFRIWWRDQLWGIHANRIGTWAHGILEKFPKLEDVSRENKKYALRRIAFINLKKIAGKSSSSYPEILKHVRLMKKELLKQIEIINPDLIIGGITWKSIWKEIFPSY